MQVRCPGTTVEQKDPSCKPESRALDSFDLALLYSSTLETISSVKFGNLGSLELHHSRFLLANVTQVRDAELSQQWKAYLAETLLMMCWIAGPIMFAAITLTSISLYEGSLSPSTAFTALAVFQRLEGTLSLVPQLVTDFSNAWISLGRIESFLNSPERVDPTVDANVITFEGASIAWPSEHSDIIHPVLRDLNLRFPRHELSLIVGPTGVGKSLMLATIIGEAEVLAGTVRRPKANTTSYSHSPRFRAPYTTWIIPKSIAFVAQTPWIENASLKDNILFGLPFVEARYTLVLHACALLQDINIMEDGDSTEVGAHGISLSGGQRSRLALARALYSRAETLVIDDIFSAVDTHVGRHLLYHALVGELAKERTCLVATHHLQLCLSKASFVVMLNNKTVGYAGPTKMLMQESTQPEDADDVVGISDIPVKEKGSPLSSSLSLSSGDVSSETSSGREETTSLGRLSQEQHKAILGYSVKSRSSSRKPRKLVQEELRHKGRTKLHVYKSYLRAASRWPWTYWTIVITLLIG